MVKNNIVVLLAMLILILGFFTYTLHLSGLAVFQCTDTDGGNVFTKGKVTADRFVVEDTCVTDKKLQEFRCTPSGRVRFDTVNCPTSCNDGACAKPPEGYGGLIKESFSFGTRTNKLEINENLGFVVEALTQVELDSLASGLISTSEGATRYSQFLRFKSSDFSSGKVVYEENEENEVGDYLYFETDEPIFEYEVQFENGLESEVENNKLNDLEGKRISLLGATYTIVGARLSDSTVELRLLSGSTTDTLEEGASKKYLVNGKEYDVEFVMLDDEQDIARFRINGIEINNLKKGDTAVFGDLLFGLADTTQSEAGEGFDLARFYFGARYIALKDNAGDDVFSQGVRINGRSVAAASVKVKGQRSGDVYKISSIKYRLDADAQRGGDIYITPGSSLSGYLQDNLGILGDWDIVYKGLSKKPKAPVSLIRLNPSGDDAYRLLFTNMKGDTYNMPFVKNSGGSLVIGSADKTLHFIESSSSLDFKVAQQDWVVMTNRNDRGGVTNVLRYTNIDTTNKQLYFDDLATGSKQMTYSGTEGTDAQGDLVVSGNSYKVYVGPAPDYKLAVDLTDDGAFNSREANIVVYGGGIIDLGSTSAPGGSFTITLKTEAKQFDEAAADEVISITIQNTGSGVDINIPSQAGLSLENEDGTTLGLSNYGVEFLQKHNGADTLTMKYPSGEQAIADVAVVFYDTGPSVEYQILKEIPPEREPIAAKPEQIVEAAPIEERPAETLPSYKEIPRRTQLDTEQHSVLYIVFRTVLRLLGFVS